MKILEELRQRITKEGSNSISGQLHSLASAIEGDCRLHLKRISSVLPEFDLHDDSHSEKVLGNIESLLGDTGIHCLSSYELFLLNLAPFLHDCALAPPDWELKLLKLTEGGDRYSHPDCLLKNDLKAPMKLLEAVSFIEKNRAKLYTNFDEVSRWRFSPETQELLHNELASILVEYQKFRNGSKKTLDLIKSQEEYEKESEAIRLSFVRKNHHLRIEKYITNLSSQFEDQITGRVWGKKLAVDLSKICRSHCENVSYIENSLGALTHYVGEATANLQLIALLLRLGDILHFSFDRAPQVLRTSKEFQSEYSFQQWAMKDNGVNYSIGDSQISFKAFCENPRDYFKVHEYLDWVDQEIQNYFLFERKWQKKYIKLPERVDRSGVTSDGSFIPKHGLKFTLSQERILELLMGVGLYKDKYACLRELYQNSLDACRSMRATSIQEEGDLKFKIEFDIERKGNDTFLICRDNGCGMTEDVIENYLLNIGNSYYRSSEFARMQASWDNSFTPTSQFGIGILSCFMIGSSIEITTKKQGCDFISCAIDGPHESFYYKTPSKFHTERIVRSGTEVRILLHDSISSELNNQDLEKVELLLLRENPKLTEEFRDYKSIYKNWNGHLFNKINSIVDSPFSYIDVLVSLEGGGKLKVPNKPSIFSMTSEVEEDVDFINYLVGNMYWRRPAYLFSDVKDNVKTYEIKIEHEGVDFRAHLSLPINSKKFGDTTALDVMPIIGTRGVCIDGISVREGMSIPIEVERKYPVSRVGLLNFVGEKRPQLSVDRTAITSWPETLEQDLSKITSKLTYKILDIVNEHVESYDLAYDSKEVRLIWDYIFDRFSFGFKGFVSAIIDSQYGAVSSEDLCSFTESKITIIDFVKCKYLKLKSPNSAALAPFSEALFYGKLLSSNLIEVEKDEISLKHENPRFKLPEEIVFATHGEVTLIKSDKWDVEYDYDLVSDLLPVVSERLFNAITLAERVEKGLIEERGVKITIYSNGIGSFFNQSPLAINDKMGLFSTKEREFHERPIDSEVLYFESKRADFNLTEINNWKAKYEGKLVKVLSVFVSPRELTTEENERLEDLISSESSYVKGVREGWSLLITGMPIDNIIIIPGRCSKEVLVNKLSDRFWQEYLEHDFQFLDGTNLREYKSSN